MCIKKLKKSKEEQPLEFSKILLIQESALIWVHTLALLVLAYICVFMGSYTELPWLTAMTALPWSAYAVSQHAYYKKAQAENSKDGIIFETAMADYSIDSPVDEVVIEDEDAVG